MFKINLIYNENISYKKYTFPSLNSNGQREKLKIAQKGTSFNVFNKTSA